MAKKNPGDILTCDWNPVIGCERYSAGCAGCWYLDGIFPWQQRLGNIPTDVHPNEHYVFENRLTEASLRPKRGIVGVVQHGDLFWDQVPDEAIHAFFPPNGLSSARRPAMKHGRSTSDGSARCATSRRRTASPSSSSNSARAIKSPSASWMAAPGTNFRRGSRNKRTHNPRPSTDDGIAAGPALRWFDGSYYGHDCRFQGVLQPGPSGDVPGLDSIAAKGFIPGPRRAGESWRPAFLRRSNAGPAAAGYRKSRLAGMHGAGAPRGPPRRPAAGCQGTAPRDKRCPVCGGDLEYHDESITRKAFHNPAARGLLGF